MPRARAGVLGLAIVVALAPWILASCARAPAPRAVLDVPTNAHDDPASPPETPLPHRDDPLEPTNRAMAGFNFALLDFLVQPIARGYRFVVPGLARRSVTHFFENLRYPVRLVGNVLRGTFAGAWQETERFAVNTTWGLLGFRDPATGMGLPATDADVGRAFSSWGWAESTYLMLPVLGPSSVRDTLALPVDTLLDPATFFFPANAFRALNDGSDRVDTAVNVLHTFDDPYQIVRMYSALRRELDTTTLQLARENHPSVETLGATYLAPRSQDFAHEASQREVRIESTGRLLPYDLFLADGCAPIVFILPGLGGHRESMTAYGLAQIVRDAGCSAVTISNAMNWEFMDRASTAAVPGFAPHDAEDVRAALAAILSDVERRDPGRASARILMGMSLGAFHTLWIAAHEDDASPVSVRFDRYVAINPPVRFARGLDQLDAYFNAPMALPEEQREPFVNDLLRKAIDLLESQQVEPGSLLPFTRMEAEFLIGLAFRISLGEIIMASQERQDLGVLKTPRDSWNRSAAYDECQLYSWHEYMQAFVLRWYGQQDPTVVSAEDLLGRCDLRAWSAALAANPRVRVFTNTNDFLLAPDDVGWLERTFGPSRLTLREHGGHLGNLYQPGVQEELRAMLCLPKER